MLLHHAGEQAARVGLALGQVPVAGLLRRAVDDSFVTRGESRRRDPRAPLTPLKLFDLVFVLAIAQVTGFPSDDRPGAAFFRAAGARRALVGAGRLRQADEHATRRERSPPGHARRGGRDARRRAAVPGACGRRSTCAGPRSRSTTRGSRRTHARVAVITDALRRVPRADRHDQRAYLEPTKPLQIAALCCPDGHCGPPLAKEGAGLQPRLAAAQETRSFPAILTAARTARSNLGPWGQVLVTNFIQAAGSAGRSQRLPW